MSKDQLVEQLGKETQEYDQFLALIKTELLTRQARIKLLQELIEKEEKDEKLP